MSGFVHRDSLTCGFTTLDGRSVEGGQFPEGGQRVVRPRSLTTVVTACHRCACVSVAIPRLRSPLPRRLPPEWQVCRRLPLPPLRHWLWLRYLPWPRLGRLAALLAAVLAPPQFNATRAAARAHRLAARVVVHAADLTGPRRVMVRLAARRTDDIVASAQDDARLQLVAESRAGGAVAGGVRQHGRTLRAAERAIDDVVAIEFLPLVHGLAAPPAWLAVAEQRLEALLVGPVRLAYAALFSGTAITRHGQSRAGTVR
jgi:hypothetical protein